MKIQPFLFIMLLYTSPILSQSVWTPYAPIPQGNSLRKIKAVNQEFAIGVGEAGTITRTTDGGKSWNTQQCAAYALNSVFIVDRMTGYCVGDSGTILSTKNGGQTWEKNTSPVKTNFNDVCFTSTDTGWAVGSSEFIVYTTNGGANWVQKRIDTLTVQIELNAIQFFNRNQAIIGGYSTICGCCWGSKIYRTTDGGSSWEIRNSSMQKRDSGIIFYFIKSMHFLDSNTGWVAGVKRDNVMPTQYIAKTVNGGVTFIEQPLPSQILPDPRSIFFNNDRKGWCVYNGQGLLHTDDGGSSWQTVTDNVMTTPIRSIFFTDSNNGWLCGYNGLVLKTVTGGDAWLKCSRQLPFTMSRVIYRTRNCIWALGRGLSTNGVFAVSSNAGVDWNITFSDLQCSFEALHILDSKRALLFGRDDGNMWRITYKTTDDGLTWEQINVDTLLDTYSFVDAQYGFALKHNNVNNGTKSILYTTVDSGYTWSSSGRIDKVYIDGMTFTTQNNGYCISSSPATVYKTSNGGKSWTKQALPGQTSLSAIGFTDIKTGWICGSQGLVSKTVDGGATWSTINTGFSHDFLSLCFVNSNKGWICGTEGCVVMTGDGGKTWLQEPTGTKDYLRYIYLTDTTNGWIIAGSGSVLTREAINLTNTIPPPFHSSLASQPRFRVLFDKRFKCISLECTALLNKSTATFELFSPNGKKVRLFRIPQTSRNSYSYRFPSAGLAAGVYFYRLRIAGAPNGQAVQHGNSLMIIK